MTVWINKIIQPPCFIRLCCLHRLVSSAGVFRDVHRFALLENVPQTGTGRVTFLICGRRWYASVISGPINRENKIPSSWQTKRVGGLVQGETMDDRSFGYGPGPFIRKKVRRLVKRKPHPSRYKRRRLLNRPPLGRISFSDHSTSSVQTLGPKLIHRPLIAAVPTNVDGRANVLRWCRAQMNFVALARPPIIVFTISHWSAAE
jgi:hypothetical protein